MSRNLKELIIGQWFHKHEDTNATSLCRYAANGEFDQTYHPTGGTKFPALLDAVKGRFTIQDNRVYIKAKPPKKGLFGTASTPLFAKVPPFSSGFYEVVACDNNMMQLQRYSKEGETFGPPQIWQRDITDILERLASSGTK